MRSRSLMLIGTPAGEESCGVLLYRLGGSKALFKAHIAGADVRVELVLAVSALLERSEQAAVIFPKWRGFNAATHHGGIHVRIISRVADSDNQFAGVKFKILVSGNFADFQLPGGHADE